MHPGSIFHYLAWIIGDESGKQEMLNATSSIHSIIRCVCVSELTLTNGVIRTRGTVDSVVMVYLNK